jgi:hypothetical protein
VLAFGAAAYLLVVACRAVCAGNGYSLTKVVTYLLQQCNKVGVNKDSVRAVLAGELFNLEVFCSMPFRRLS